LSQNQKEVLYVITENKSSIMSQQIKVDYTKTYLLPPSLEDWVPENHPVRFIREFIDSLKLEELGFKVEDNTEGRPYYSSDIMLKIWLYGYFNKTRSSRELEKQTRENIGLLWLIGMERPDHNTIWRFWKNNKQSLRKIFKEAVITADKLDLIGMVLNAIDGTKIKAYSSNKGLHRKEELEQILMAIEDSINEMTKEVEAREKEEVGSYTLPEGLEERSKLREKIQKALEQKTKEDKGQINPDEHEARVMINSGKKELSYNAQAVVDSKNGLIVSAEVVNDGGDAKQLIPMIESTKENMGRVAQENLADGGYATAEQIGLADEKGYNVLVNLTDKSNLQQRKDEPYHPSNFRYDKEKDVVICPENKELGYYKTKDFDNKRYKVRLYRTKECNGCRAKELCTGKKSSRTVNLSEYHESIERQRLLNKELSAREKLKRRKAIVEPIFGIIKQAHNFRRFTYKGIENAKTQWSMICTAVNLRKLFLKWSSNNIKFA
jgi:transposase